MSLFGRPVWVEAVTPLVGDGLQVGDIWTDLFNNSVNQCTSISPVTFTVIGGGGGTGTVTQVNTGTGLTGGPITTSGTVTLADTAVTPGNYTLSSLTVDQQGRLTAASSGSPQTITLTSDITGSGTGSFSTTLATVNSDVGSYTNASATVNAKGLVTAISSGTAPVTSITGTANQITVTGTTTPTISLSSTYVGQTSITTLGTISTGSIPNTLISGLGTLSTQSGTFSGTSSGTNTGDQTVTLTGDATGSGTGSFATTIAAGAVTLAKMANLAANSIIGNNTGSPATPIALTSSQVSTFLSLGTLSTQSGTFSGTSSGTNTGDQTITLTGNVTGSGTGSFATTIANSAVTLAKIANQADQTFLGNVSGGSAAPVALTAAQGKTLLNLTGTNSGDQTITLTGDVTGTGTGSFATTLTYTFPGRNRLINGDAQVWQRGAGGSASIAVAASTTSYTADRWQLATGANQAYHVIQAAGATSGSFLFQVQRDSGQTGTGAVLFCSSLPRGFCIGAAGNIITLSFKALSGANYSPTSGALGVKVYSGTGSIDISGINGAFTGTANAISQTATLTGGSQNFTYSSSALGSTVTQLAVEFSMTPTGTAGANDWFQVTDVQLEVSPKQTPFDRLSFHEQKFRCLPFYQKSFNYNRAPAQNVGGSTGEFFMLTILGGNSGNYQGYQILSPPLIATPTIVLYNPQAANAQIRNETNATDSTTSQVGASSAASILWYCNPPIGTLANNLLGIHSTCDSELI